MAISFPLDLPATPAAKRISLMADANVALSESAWTFANQVQVHMGQRWICEVTLPPMTRDQAENWQAFLLKLNGLEGTFFVGDPLARTPRGSASGIPLVQGIHARGQRELVTDGWTPSQTGILLAGDYIQIGSRLHKVLNDADSDGSGVTTLDIFPRLRENVTDNTPIITQSTRGIFRLAGNRVGLFDVDVEKFYDVSFSAIEAI